MKYALTVVATLAVLLLFGLVFPYTGCYNVSAVEGHTGFGRWFFNTTSTRSIKARADDIAVPTDLADSTRALRGAGNFEAMCVVCHGAPGVERGEIGEGISPRPPRLSEAATMWSPEEIYWILREGIKNAGIPAFSPTHDDEALWDLVAFVERLPEMTPERYRALAAAAPGHHGQSGDAAPDSASGGHHGNGHTH